MNKMTEETGQRLIEAWAEYEKNVDWHASISENVCEAFRAGYVAAMRQDERLAQVQKGIETGWKHPMTLGEIVASEEGASDADAEQIANAIAREVIHKTKATLFDGETI
jgi:hypothetical protein